MGLPTIERMLRTFGKLEVEGDRFRRPKPLLLLAFLTLEGCQLRSHLEQLFWPNNPQANRNLTTTLGRLKTALPHRVFADTARAWSGLTCDVQLLRRELGDGDLQSALALYRGPFLDGHYLPEWSTELEEWVYELREAVSGELRRALFDRARLEAGRGQLESGAAWAERAAVLPGAAPAEPELLAQLHAILRAGDHPLAARLEADAAGYGISLPDSPAAARQLVETLQPGVSEHNLPLRGGPFIGREVELADVSRALSASHCRLLSLVGQGGAGKTRLALQVAREALTSGSNGSGYDAVHFVGLEAARDFDAATAAIATALGVEVAAGSDVVAHLARTIRRRRQLLVLDNLEQLADSARLATALLEHSENLKLLVTSRERLDIGAEWVVPIEGLSYPPPGLPVGEARLFDAVQLFMLRARQASGKEPSSADLSHVARICRLLQGAPLGVELAASLTRALPCSEIADEAERNFDSLRRTSAGGNERHQSLRAAFDHSWRLLTSDEQHMLGRLSAFSGGFARAAALEVAQGSAGTLVSLLNKSLIYRTADDRFALHPVTRQYAYERLVEDAGQHGTTLERHARYFLHLAEAAESHLKGPDQVRWLASLTVDHSNLRTALDWSLEQDRVELGLRLATALQQFWWLRGPYQEGYAYLTTLLERTRSFEHPRLRSKALHRAGTLSQQLGDRPTAVALYEEAQALAETHSDAQLLADALHSRALVAFQQGEFALSSGLYARCLDLQRGIGDRWGVAMTLNNMASIELEAGRHERARELLQESLALKEELGDVQGIAYALNNLGNVILELGETDDAKALLERSLALKRQLDDRGGVAISLTNLARIARQQERFEDARGLLSSGLRALESLENGWTMVAVLSELAELEAADGRPERALRIAGGVEALNASLATASGAVGTDELGAVTRRATSLIGPKVASRLRSEGYSMDVAALIAWLCRGPGEALQRTPSGP